MPVLAIAIAAGGAEAQAKPRLAVLGFENNTTSRLFGDGLGHAASDELTTQLVKTGEFTVLERQQIQSILDEQHAGASGAIDPATAAAVGKLLGAQLVVLGSITQFSIDQKSGGIGRLSASYAEAESMLDVRIVDVNTGAILAVAEGQGKKRFGGAQYKDINLERSFDAGVAQEALRPAVESAVERILGEREKLAAVGSAGPNMQVVGVRDGAIYVDRGENGGLKVGQKLVVHRVIDTIRDAGGNILDEVTDRVGVIEVTRVLSQSAICKVVEGEALEGDRVGIDS
jgi:curli biogenesis system outer membrane secretion channel CsgG